MIRSKIENFSRIRERSRKALVSEFWPRTATPQFAIAALCQDVRRATFPLTVCVPAANGIVLPGRENRFSRGAFGYGGSDSQVFAFPGYTGPDFPALSLSSADGSLSPGQVSQLRGDAEGFEARRGTVRDDAADFLAQQCERTACPGMVIRVGVGRSRHEVPYFEQCRVIVVHHVRIARADAFECQLRPIHFKQGFEYIFFHGAAVRRTSPPGKIAVSAGYLSGEARPASTAMAWARSSVGLV